MMQVFAAVNAGGSADSRGAIVGALKEQRSGDRYSADPHRMDSKVDLCVARRSLVSTGRTQANGRDHRSSSAFDSEYSRLFSETLSLRKSALLLYPYVPRTPVDTSSRKLNPSKPLRAFPCVALGTIIRRGKPCSGSNPHRHVSTRKNIALSENIDGNVGRCNRLQREEDMSASGSRRQARSGGEKRPLPKRDRVCSKRVTAVHVRVNSHAEEV